MTDRDQTPVSAAPAEAPAVRTYRGRPRRREFVVTCVGDETDRTSGFGVTLDQVLAHLAAMHARCGFVFDDDNEGLDDLRERWDEVIWEGDVVAAVVRVDVEGRLEVVRFDGAADAPTGTVIQDAPASGDDDDDDQG